MKQPSRDPGPAIRRLLRAEVNLGCPVRFADGTGCGSPVLTYHHFDPPWHGHHQHEPDGMIALCPTHHAQADGGLWSKAQLRELKRTPYVDEAIKVQWPWRPETLVMKVGPSLVVGSGSPMRLNTRPVMQFRPVTIQPLGVRTVGFESDLRDETGASWLRISDSWFDLRLEGTTDLQFAPQTKTFSARHSASTQLSMRFRSMPFEDFRAWLPRFMTNPDIAESAAGSVERVGGIDSDGNVPVVTFEGSFRTKHLAIQIAGDRMSFESFVPGLQETFDWHSWVVDDTRRALLKSGNGQEFFSLG